MKALWITGGLLAFGFGVKKALDLTGKADAAKKLIVELDSVKVTKASLQQGVEIDVFLNMTNPSANDLAFKDLFVVVSMATKNKDGSLSFKTLTNSNAASTAYTLPGKKTTKIKFPLYINRTAIGSAPVLAMHFVKKAAGLNPEPKKLILEYSLNSEGLNISQKQDIFI